MCDCIKSTGTVKKEYRKVENFNILHIEDNININLTEDSLIDEITIEAGENLIPLISTIVGNEILTLKNNNKCNWVRSYKKEINISVPVKNLKNIIAYGSGNIKSTNTLIVDTLTIELWNSSHIEIAIDAAASYSVLHVGVGDIILKGNTAYSYLYSAGNGWAYLDNLISGSSEIDHRGTGNCFVNAQTELRASIRSIGDVYYQGNPSSITSSITGKGNLIKID